MLAITPRIIGNISRPQAEISEYWSGTENVITDKPQLNLPASTAPPTPQEKMLEQMRLRQQQSGNPEPESQVQIEQPPPSVQQETNINADGSLNALEPPAALPNQLPQAQDVPIPGL